MQVTLFGAPLPEKVSKQQVPKREVKAMPIHDWTRVDAGLFHDFHHEWISTTKRAARPGESRPITTHWPTRLPAAFIPISVYPTTNRSP